MLRDGQARADLHAVTLTVALKALQRRRRVSLLPRFARRAVLFAVDGGTRALTGEHPRRIALFPGPRLLDVDLTVLFVVGFAERLHALSVAQRPGFRVFHVPLGRTRLEPVLARELAKLLRVARVGCSVALAAARALLLGAHEAEL